MIRVRVPFGPLTGAAGCLLAGASCLGVAVELDGGWLPVVVALAGLAALAFVPTFIVDAALTRVRIGLRVAVDRDRIQQAVRQAVLDAAREG